MNDFKEPQRGNFKQIVKVINIYRKNVLRLFLIKVRETKGAMKNGQCRETGNIGYTRRRQTKQKTQHNMCWAPLFANKHK